MKDYTIDAKGRKVYGVVRLLRSKAPGYKTECLLGSIIMNNEAKDVYIFSVYPETVSLNNFTFSGKICKKITYQEYRQMVEEKKLKKQKEVNKILFKRAEEKQFRETDTEKNDTMTLTDTNLGASLCERGEDYEDIN